MELNLRAACALVEEIRMAAGAVGMDSWRRVRENMVTLVCVCVVVYGGGNGRNSMFKKLWGCLN